MDYVIIGKIINTHGIKGELKIDPLTSDIDRFLKLEKIYIGDEKEKFTYEKSRLQKNFVIMKLKEFNHINDVIRLKDKYVYVDINDRIELGKDEYFISDLIGCCLYDTSGKQLGSLVDVYELASNDVYEIKQDDKTYYIPAVKEYVKNIDIQSKSIIIDPIEGMIP